MLFIQKVVCTKAEKETVSILKEIIMNEILPLWYIPEHSTTSIKGWCTTGVHCTLARLVIIQPNMIIKSCDGSVAPPPCMHTLTHRNTH